MRKMLVIAVAIILMMSLFACRSSSKADLGQGSSMQQDLPSSGVPIAQGLHFLCDPDGSGACSTPSGYYYLTTDMKELQDGSYGTHLMYMDYASCREVYLCSTAGCKHDSPDCPSVCLCDDFPLFSTKLFVFQDHLYILSREPDNDGTMSSGFVYAGSDEEVESKPAILYRANLDGTQREKAYTFDTALTLEDLVIGDAGGIYVITKKVSSDTEDSVSYFASSEQRLMFLDMESMELKDVCPMDFGDHISWKVIGCSGESLVLSGVDFGRELSREEIWDDDVHKSLYENSFDVYALLELSDGSLKEICRQSNKSESSSCIIGDVLYLSSKENQNIEGLNLATGERKTVCTLPQNLIMRSMGENILCCRDWNLAGDYTYYFVDVSTGAVSHSALVNQCNGWDLEFCAENQTDVLVVYDYEAIENGDGSYEILQNKYALISKEDLLAGKENYRKIEMAGLGSKEE